MDRISGLSDELLIKILSFVPTKVAVSTSILSKRWEYLWMWLPKLEYGFSPRSDSESTRLRSFLDRKLPLHRAPVIESFRLQLYGSCFKPENIKLWLVIAVSHCLRELEILYDESCPARSGTILPSNLYTCKSLVILKLDGKILLDVPRVASLPSLKTLKLHRVRYFNDQTLQRLLSNCPILEDLVVVLYDHCIMGEFTVVVPSLQSLSLSIPCYHNIDRFVIETPTLKYLKLEDCSNKRHYWSFENMPYLIEAYVNVVDSPYINSLVGSITSVKRLTICSEAMCDAGFVFNQLEHLELCTAPEHSPNQLLGAINASSNLQELILFEMDNHVYTNSMASWNQPNTVPECMLSSLQTVSWSPYSGKPEELDVAVYILKHAVQLKTFSITSCQSRVTKFEMIKELALSSRASAACQLMFN